MKFGIVTATKGRPELSRCIESIQDQKYKDFIHIVVGDGPLDLCYRELCNVQNTFYYETSVKKEGFGGPARNIALRIFEVVLPVDYIMIVDDDNTLFSTALFNLEKVAKNRHPLLYHDIIFRNAFNPEWKIFTPELPPKVTKWDALHGCLRADILAGIVFGNEYDSDVTFAMEAQCRSGTDKWVKAEGFGGIHY